MGSLSKCSLTALSEIQNSIAQQTSKAKSLEDAAQEYMTILYNNFSESIVLARLFATIPFKDLPESNKQFVTNLGASNGVDQLIKENTLVLSLLGTKGAKEEWNTRQGSKGHVGIPLVSANFVDKIPMMSRLLKELGSSIDWIDSTDTQLVAKTFRSMSGVFYVADAATEVDVHGRKIISAQDFVNQFLVKTVFGIGGCYLGTTIFFTVIVFLNERIEKDLAERFMLQANKFKTATNMMIEDGKIFN
ncbi:MAG: hypothetical protein HQK49_07385 [Oligoflexia bacterium]|nr:hypothetical protein [Oligoflexia bacterium]